MIDEILLQSLEVASEKILPYLNDPQVIEIMVNPDGKIWIERYGESQKHVGEMPDADSRHILNLMASAYDCVVDSEHPILEGVFPLGQLRFEGLVPPCVEPHCSFSMRKKANRIISMDEYIKQGAVTPYAVKIITEAIKNHKNIVCVGGTSSGKTTFLNACIKVLNRECPDERLLIIEDTPELQSSSPNTVFLKTVPQAGISMQKLSEVAMRYAPRRILVGEVRNAAALDLLKLWDTGHDGGLGTFHANSAEEGLYRLEELVEEATSAPKQKLIGRAVDLVLFMTKTKEHTRKLAEIVRVNSYDATEKRYKTERIYVA